ncbi:hypothetical protein H6F95_05330 [Cyanobacteria bacterium FACHB-471]|nr:hypothetical protein [Cyanobacteria bacterium FACHB-471]
MILGCCVVTLASHDSLPSSPIPLCLLGFTYFCQAARGEALAHRIVEVIRSLPGFEEFCGHQHEVAQLAKAWARAAERRYYPYGSKKPLPPGDDRNSLEPKELTPNQKRAQDAKERIRQAIANLLEKNALPTQTTARRNAIRAYKIGNKTLDKNRDLWHPESLNPLSEEQYHSTEPNLENSNCPEPLPEAEYHPIATNKLLPPPASAPPAQEAGEIDLLAVGGAGGLSTGDASENSQPTPELQPTEPADVPVIEPGPALIREILSKIALQSQQAKQGTPSTQPLPDENYFRQVQQRQGDRLRGREVFIQQSLELPGIDLPPAPAPVSESHSTSVQRTMSENRTNSPPQSVQVLLSAIESEVERLGWIAAQGSIWVAQHFAGKERSQLSARELVLLLRQLKQLHQNL